MLFLGGCERKQCLVDNFIQKQTEVIRNVLTGKQKEICLNFNIT